MKHQKKNFLTLTKHNMKKMIWKKLIWIPRFPPLVIQKFLSFSIRKEKKMEKHVPNPHYGPLLLLMVMWGCIWTRSNHSRERKSKKNRPENNFSWKTLSSLLSFVIYKLGIKMLWILELKDEQKREKMNETNQTSRKELRSLPSWCYKPCV